MTVVVLVSALVGGIAVTGSATALEADTAAPYPHSPGTTSESFVVSVIVERGDAIAKNGMKSITLNFAADSSFDGSVKNVSVETVSVYVSSRSNTRTIGAFNVSTNPKGKITVTFKRPVPVSPGDRIIVDAGNVTTPSAEGTYVVGVTATAPSGKTDGPVTVEYRVAAAELDFPNQTASQFSKNQTITVSGVVPNAGYVAVFTVAENGTRGQLVGVTEPIIAQYDARTYTVNLNGNVEESQKLVAVVYYETSGGTQAERLNGSFDPSEDAVVTNNGKVANATGFVTTVNADARITAGKAYPQGIRLFFSQGQPNTAYRIQTVTNGKPGQIVAQFETAANGTEIIDTTEFAKGQYVITRIADGSVVSLDGDSTTGPGDDTFFITGQTYTETTATTNGSAGNATTTGASGSNNNGGDGSGAGQTKQQGSGSGSNGGDSGGSGSSGVFGPGFGIVIAVVALLGAALLATRRE